MKKLQKTFAERAKAIQKRFPRSEWDSIERKDMLKELRALKDEQEQVRSLMEVADNANKMDAQGVAMPRLPQDEQFTEMGQNDQRFAKWAADVPGRPQGFDINPEMLDMPGSAQRGGLAGAPMQMHGGMLNYDGLSLNTGVLPDSTKVGNNDAWMRSQGYGKDKYGTWTTNAATNDYYQNRIANTIPGTGIKSQVQSDIFTGVNKGPLYPYIQRPPYTSMDPTTGAPNMTDLMIYEGNRGNKLQTQLPYSPLQSVKNLQTPWRLQQPNLPYTPGSSYKPKDATTATTETTQTGPTYDNKPGSYPLTEPPAGLNMSGSDPYINPWDAPKDNLSLFRDPTTGTQGPNNYVFPENAVNGVGSGTGYNTNASNSYAFPEDTVNGMGSGTGTGNGYVFPEDVVGGYTDNTGGTAAAATQGAGTASQFKTPGTSMLPFLLSGASSVIGDLAQLRNLKNMPKRVNLGRMTASKIDLEPQRQRLSREFGDQQRTNVSNARNMGLQGANAYANMVSANTAGRDQYGSAMNQSYMQEQNSNAGLAQQANQTNSQLNAQEAMQNMQLKQQQVAGKSGIIDSLANTFPGMMRDYRQQANQQNTINLMGQDMGMYQRIQQDPSFLQRLAQQMGVDPRVILARLDPRIKQ